MPPAHVQVSDALTWIPVTDLEIDVVLALSPIPKWWAKIEPIYSGSSQVSEAYRIILNTNSYSSVIAITPHSSSNLYLGINPLYVHSKSSNTTFQIDRYFRALKDLQTVAIALQKRLQGN